MQGCFAHVGCEEQATGVALTEEGVADADWFCSQVHRVQHLLSSFTAAVS